MLNFDCVKHKNATNIFVSKSCARWNQTRAEENPKTEHKDNAKPRPRKTNIRQKKPSQWKI